MNVKAGDKVELIYGSGNISKVAIVEGVTPKGFIKVSGMTFYPDGWQRGRGYMVQMLYKRDYRRKNRGTTT